MLRKLRSFGAKRLKKGGSLKFLRSDSWESRRNSRLTVLTFHRVLEQPDDLQLGEPSALQFEKWISKWARWFQFLPLSEAVNALGAGRLGARRACITFDDGYANNLEIAAPILSKLGLPATFFIATGFSSGGTMFNDKLTQVFRSARGSSLDLSAFNLDFWPIDSLAARRDSLREVILRVKHLKYAEREALVDAIVLRSGSSLEPHPMMTTEQVKKLAHMGFEIGAHTVSHPILRELTDSEAEGEIRTSRQQLQAITGQKVEMFAYPNGRPGEDYDLRHAKMVQDAGFIGAVSTIPGAASKADDLYQIPRFTPWHGASWKSGIQFLRNYRTPIKALRP
jgi:peptidoglycan/xylan/chitin deacetylase (PgdA/CDA1 family)